MAHTALFASGVLSRDDASTTTLLSTRVVIGMLGTLLPKVTQQPIAPRPPVKTAPPVPAPQPIEAAKVTTKPAEIPAAKVAAAAAPPPATRKTIPTKPLLPIAAAPAKSAPEMAKSMVPAATIVAVAPIRMTSPKYRETPRPPRYPARARRLGQQGVVQIRARLDPRGDVIDVKLANSSGFRALDLAALRAVREWRFVPAQRNGSAVAAEVMIPVRFRLR